jgi:hypothetical protein
MEKTGEEIGDSPRPNRLQLVPQIGRASVRSKCIVGGMAVASFLIPWRIATILGQLAVSLYVLLYLKAFPPGDDRSS